MNNKNFESVAGLEAAKEQELAKLTESKKLELFEIRKKQIALRDAIDSCKKEGREPENSSLDALNESNKKAEELIRDDKVASVIMEEAFNYDINITQGKANAEKKRIIDEAVSAADSFLREYLHDHSLSDSVEIGMSSHGQTPLHQKPTWYGLSGSYLEDGTIHIILRETPKLFKKAILEPHLESIKTGIAEILDRKLGDLLLRVEVGDCRSKKVNIFEWKRFIATHIIFDIHREK